MSVFSMLACYSVKIISQSTHQLWWFLHYSQIIVKKDMRMMELPLIPDDQKFHMTLMWLNNLLRFFKCYYNMSFTFHHITQLSAIRNESAFYNIMFMFHDK